VFFCYPSISCLYCIEIVADRTVGFFKKFLPTKLHTPGIMPSIMVSVRVLQVMWTEFVIKTTVLSEARLGEIRNLIMLKTSSLQFCDDVLKHLRFQFLLG